MRPRRRQASPRRRIFVPLSVFVVLVAGTGVAFASFSGAAAASHTVSTATLAPATGLLATGTCNGLLSAKATLTWTATSSTFASGYKIQRYKGGSPDGSLTTISPRTTTTLTQTGLSTGTSYTWDIYAYYRAWTSSVISAHATTPGLCL